MIHLKMIQKIYRNAGVGVVRAKGLHPYCEDLDQIFRTLVPDSYFTFNDEFSSPDEFSLVLDGISRITGGEVSFSDGGYQEKGKSVRWWFTANDQTFSWTSKDQGRTSLDKGFFRALSKMSRSFLSGDYVFHEIDCGYMGVLYARRDVAKKLSAKLKKPSIDSLVSYYRNGGDFLSSHVYDLKEMGNMRDSKGDTIVTAILKSDASPEFRCYLAWWMIENAPVLSPYVPDGNGEMPIDIASRLGLDDFVEKIRQSYGSVYKTLGML